MPATYANVFDDSTTPSASTAGVYFDGRNRTTLSRAALGVPVRLCVYAMSEVEDDTGSVRLLDSSGSTVLEVDITEPAFAWHVVDGYVPAALDKYDLYSGGNSSGTLSVRDWCIYEYAHDAG